MNNMSYFKNPNAIFDTPKVACSKKIIDTYDLQYDEKHIVHVVKTGVINFDEKIQQFKNDNDLAHLIKIIESTGNPDYFVPKDDGFKDISEMPDNLVDAKKQVQAAEVLYSSLPDDFKNGFSMKEFVSRYKKGDLLSYIESKMKGDDK